MSTPAERLREINQAIIEPIDLLIRYRHAAAAVVLILSGIDSMANVNRPATELESTSSDFKAWVASYFQLEGQTEITSDEWWAARNAIVHTFGV